MTPPSCRHCQTPMEKVFLDLGHAPPSNAYVQPSHLNQSEMTFPLRLRVCEHCWLVQTEDFTDADRLFDENYAYFSSTSKSWLDHAARYANAMIKRLSLGKDSFVMEVASNDGYLLKNFVAAEIPCMGVEPTASTANVAEKRGILTLRKFFGRTVAEKLAFDLRSADLIVGNNVYAHVPDINDFTQGLAAALKPEGVITLEFPHLMRMVEYSQFDTAYHEHFSYLSLSVVTRIFKSAGLRIFDVEELTTHGGSLRVYGCHKDASHACSKKVIEILDQEKMKGMHTLDFYEHFQESADSIKNGLLRFLLDAKRDGKKVVGYGAAAKGNTLLNYAGVKPDLLPFICDAAAAKQGQYTPGGHIPIVSPETLENTVPDYLLILPWNIAEEVIQQLEFLRDKGVQFVIAVPAVKFL